MSEFVCRQSICQRTIHLFSYPTSLISHLSSLVSLTLISLAPSFSLLSSPKLPGIFGLAKDLTRAPSRSEYSIARTLQHL
jgi:hypothetical protein